MSIGQFSGGTSSYNGQILHPVLMTGQVGANDTDGAIEIDGADVPVRGAGVAV